MKKVIDIFAYAVCGGALLSTIAVGIACVTGQLSGPDLAIVPIATMGGMGTIVGGCLGAMIHDIKSAKKQAEIIRTLG